MKHTRTHTPLSPPLPPSSSCHLLLTTSLFFPLLSFIPFFLFSSLFSFPDSSPSSPWLLPLTEQDSHCAVCECCQQLDTRQLSQRCHGDDRKSSSSNLSVRHPHTMTWRNTPEGVCVCVWRGLSERSLFWKRQFVSSFWEELCWGDEGEGLELVSVLAWR